MEPQEHEIRDGRLGGMRPRMTRDVRASTHHPERRNGSVSVMRILKAPSFSKKTNPPRVLT